MVKSVGLLLMIDHKELGLCALLQKRGEYNFEEAKPESWPGACQVTVHGKLKPDEDATRGLIREVQEKLGTYCLDRAIGKDVATSLLRLKITEGEIVTTYAARVPANKVLRFRLSPSSGGLIILPEDKVRGIEEIDTSSESLKRKGIGPRQCVVMFSDELECLKVAFNRGAELPLLK